MAKEIIKKSKALYVRFNSLITPKQRTFISYLAEKKNIGECEAVRMILEEYIKKYK